MSNRIVTVPQGVKERPACGGSQGRQLLRTGLQRCCYGVAESDQVLFKSLLNLHNIIQCADVVELVDTLALGASAARREGSSPFIRTNQKMLSFESFF